MSFYLNRVMAFAESGAPQVEIAEDHWPRIGSAPIHGLAAAFCSQPSGLCVRAIYTPSLTRPGFWIRCVSRVSRRRSDLGLQTPVLRFSSRPVLYSCTAASLLRPTASPNAAPPHLASCFQESLTNDLRIIMKLSLGSLLVYGLAAEAHCIFQVGFRRRGFPMRFCADAGQYQSASD